MILRSLDLFAGIGGMRLGLEKACKDLGFKHECKMFSEIDKNCINTYNMNFPNTRHYGDISLIGDDYEFINSNIPDHDFLLGGFPCQPFSHAGKKLGLEDKTRGTLFNYIKNILNVKKPKFFLLENVKFLRSHDGGRTMNIILDSLRENYTVPSPVVLKSSDFNLPQKRERVFIVGKYKDSTFDFFQFPHPPKRTTHVGSVLEKNVDEKYTISTKLWKSHKIRKKNNLDNGKGFGYSLFKSDDPYTRTLTHRYYKDGSEILIDRGPNKNPRMLTPRECANLQGFPKNFKLHQSKNQNYKQFGNSVSVPVIYAIVKKVLEF
jgi:DNA (cytosine-5)-methyltransferase 1